MLLLSACDMWHAKDEPTTAPPLVHVIGANVGPNQPIAADGVIRVTFDRYLEPTSVNRQSVALRDLFGNPPSSPVVDYDPITRVVTLANPNPGQPFLTAGVSYQLLFPVASSDAGSFGVLSVDGAGLDPATPSITFPVTAAIGAPASPPPVHFCSDVFPIFVRGCGGTACHSAPAPAIGLVLDDERGLQETALGVAASEAATTAASTPLEPQATFPAGMPIIAPGYPGNSFLLYKLLRGDDVDGGSTPIAYTACQPITAPFDYGPNAGLASLSEANVLADRVYGRRMPWDQPALTLDEMERLRAWILEGAVVTDCSSCPSQ